MPSFAHTAVVIHTLMLARFFSLSRSLVAISCFPFLFFYSFAISTTMSTSLSASQLMCVRECMCVRVSVLCKFDYDDGYGIRCTYYIMHRRLVLIL